MNNKPKGGRGLKAPYQTIIVRVPLPLLETIKKQIDDFRNNLTNTEATDNQDNILELGDKVDQRLSQDEVIEKARAILKSRKSAKVSITNLLQVIYGNNNIEI